MKVRELIAILQNFDPDLMVLTSSGGRYDGYWEMPTEVMAAGHFKNHVERNGAVCPHIWQESHEGPEAVTIY